MYLLHTIESWVREHLLLVCSVKVLDVGHQAGTSEMARRSQQMWREH